MIQRDEHGIALNPGREIDALIAEKVMGFGHNGLMQEAPGIVVLMRDWSELPKYSTDIADAWKVFEKLQQMNPTSDFWLGKNVGGWCVWDGKTFPDGTPWVDVYSGSAAHAICLAALKAVKSRT